MSKNTTVSDLFPGRFSCPRCDADVRVSASRRIIAHQDGPALCAVSGALVRPARGDGRIVCGVCGKTTICDASYAAVPRHGAQGRKCPGSGRMNSRVMSLIVLDAGSVQVPRVSTVPAVIEEPAPGGEDRSSRPRKGRSLAAEREFAERKERKAREERRRAEQGELRRQAVERIKSAESAKRQKAKRPPRIIRQVVSGGLPD